MPILRLPLKSSGRPEIDLALDISTVAQEDDPTAVIEPRPITALLDTGASRSLVDIDILESFGLTQEGEDIVNTASSGNDPEVVPLYSVNLWIAGEQRGLLAEDLKVAGSDKLAALQVEMLLGRDVLNQCLLIYDGSGRFFSLAYDSPVVRPALSQ